MQRKRHKAPSKAERKGYPIDLKEREWQLIVLLPPKTAKTGTPHKVNFREIINALSYMVRTGCEWRMLPNDFPPYQAL